MPMRAPTGKRGALHALAVSAVGSGLSSGHQCRTVPRLFGCQASGAPDKRPMTGQHRQEPKIGPDEQDSERYAGIVTVAIDNIAQQARDRSGRKCLPEVVDESG